MLKWYEVLSLIERNSGKMKQKTLELNKNNETLKEVLLFLNNPRIVTGISKKKWESIGLDVSDYRGASADITDIMNYLKENNTGKIINVLYVKNIIAHMSDEEAIWAEKIVLKDCPIGISASTINKVWPGLVPVFKLMKGKKWDGEYIEDEFILSLKIDGNSATVFNLDDETYILSRSGAIMEGFEHIIEFYRKNLPLNYVYCGEFLKRNYENLEHGELFRVTNGIVNSKDKDKSSIQHVVFDMVPYEEYKNNSFSETFYTRHLRIMSNFEQYSPYFREKELDEGYEHLDAMHVPYLYRGKNNEFINYWLDDAKNNKLEGLMLNLSNEKYKFGPQKRLLKIKDFYTMDLVVSGIKEHVRGNTTGALIVDYKGNKVGVPSMSDENRKLFWENKDKIIGKVVEVKYFRETEDKFGNKSLRFPSFVRVREDKTQDDVSYE